MVDRFGDVERHLVPDLLGHVVQVALVALGEDDLLQARAPELYKQFVGQAGSDEIKNFDLSVKYLADWVAQQGGSQRSDLAQTLASTRSPSVHISQRAAQQVMAAALGLENMQHVAATKFTATQGGQAN